MSDFQLLQAEADALIAMPKIAGDEVGYEYPTPGGSICVPLLSEDRRENFVLDISRGRIDLYKGKYQKRGRHVIVLVRLDFGPSVRHTNPDGEEFVGPHLHLYREGFGDKWAQPIPAGRFPRLNDLWQTLIDFYGFVNVVEQPRINRGLFV